LLLISQQLPVAKNFQNMTKEVLSMEAKKVPARLQVCPPSLALSPPPPGPPYSSLEWSVDKSLGILSSVSFHAAIVLVVSFNLVIRCLVASIRLSCLSQVSVH
jgi:hypothetical protein